MNSIWLGAMIISYLVCILTISSKEIGGGGGNSIPHTISSTLSNEETQPIIFGSMFSMGIFTLLYEYDRKDRTSFLAIIFLLIGIYGVILIEETQPIHYLFAFTAFISILFFMFQHMSNNIYDIFLCSANTILFSILVLSIIFEQENTSEGIIGYEIGFLVFFTIFYFILHFRSIL